MKFIADFFNWRKHPGNVFYVAGPIFALGILSHLALALIMIKTKGDWVYLWILLSISSLGAFAIYRILKNFGYLDNPPKG